MIMKIILKHKNNDDLTVNFGAISTEREYYALNHTKTGLRLQKNGREFSKK